jgi:hypothetical protein
MANYRAMKRPPKESHERSNKRGAEYEGHSGPSTIHGAEGRHLGLLHAHRISIAVPIAPAIVKTPREDTITCELHHNSIALAFPA